MSAITITKAEIEAAAIALFDDDEDRNLEFIAREDAAGRRAAGDTIGRERDVWSNHDGKPVQAAFRRRARRALEAARKVRGGHG